MMLTPEEIDELVAKGPFGFWTHTEFARAVIAENNKKVLADLKPRVLVAELGYTADQVAALIQERDALAAKVNELESELADVKYGIELASRGF